MYTFCLIYYSFTYIKVSMAYRSNGIGRGTPKIHLATIMREDSSRLFSVHFNGQKRKKK